jgi:lambda repressor-like predicted transcriptional regulator
MQHNFQGRTYTTLVSCYNDNKEIIQVGIATVRNRLKIGWSLEDALLRPKEKTFNTKFGEHIVEGRAYENLPNIAVEYGISLDAIYKRYSRGCRGDDLIPLKKRKSYTEIVPEGGSFLADGVSYKSAADACRKLNVKYITYRKKLSRGLSIEEALNLTKAEDGREARAKKYEVNGVEMTLAELSKSHQISEGTIRNRLRRGASVFQSLGLEAIPDRALIKQKEIERTKREIIEFIVDGKTYSSYKTLGDDYGLPQYVVRQRIVDYGYTPEEAVLLDGKSKAIFIAGKQYPSKSSLAEAYGLTLEVFLARLSTGATIEQAIGLENKDTSRTVVYEGENFSSLADLANKNGVSPGALRSRLRSGLTLKQSIDAGAKIANSGRYNLTIFERDDELANKPGVLYFVKITIQGKIRFKIGITAQTVENRLTPEGHPFSIINVFSGSLLACFKLEQNLLGLLSHRRDLDLTPEMLDGYSEIFDLREDDINVVLELMGEFRE